MRERYHSGPINNLVSQLEVEGVDSHFCKDVSLRANDVIRFRK